MAEAASQFGSLAQRRHADLLGMWIFLGTEAMLFGGLFMALAVYRVADPAAAKEAADHFHMWIGAFNTAVLLTSSLTMAVAATAAKAGQGRLVARMLAATGALGLVFLAVKGVEYSLEFRDGTVPGHPANIHQAGTALFIDLYFISTGLHALHLLIGCVCVGATAVAVSRRGVGTFHRAMQVEIVGLYWHFIDVVWVFLYPALYLVGRSGH